MKKIIFYTAFAAIVAGSVFTSCQSKEKKVENAKEDVQDANQKLDKAQRELSAEYPSFKKDAEAKIADNEKRIDALKAKLDKPGNAPMDEMRKKRIDELKEKNADLRSRLYGYENERSDWEAFKMEFNNDMKGIADALDDLGKGNPK